MVGRSRPEPGRRRQRDSGRRPVVKLRDIDVRPEDDRDQHQLQKSFPALVKILELRYVSRVGLHDQKRLNCMTHKQSVDHLTILVAEDNVLLRLNTFELLEEHGYTVIEADNAEEALQLGLIRLNATTHNLPWAKA